MLISCPECQRDVSDQAASCPHCGHPINANSKKTETEGRVVPSTSTESQVAQRSENTVRNAPILAILATIGLVMTLYTPRFLIFLPLMITFGLGVGSLFRKEKGKPWVVLVLLAAVGVFLLANVDPQKMRAAAPSRTVVYEVDGSATSASLTYQNGQGGTEQEKVVLPWRKSITVKERDFLYISAQNQDKYGDIVVHIIADGEEIKRSSASGAYSIASASGSCCVR
jgi:RNA polymerase subunit RPABC4/transcription elongation factor Spt4